MEMHEPYFMMSLLILGPSSPRKGIDVYLRPLIDELKNLWENGVDTNDVSRKANISITCGSIVDNQ